MENKVIKLANYRQAEPFDYYAYNRRAEIRFRNSELRAWILHAVETAVTVAIGICTVFCVYLAFTML